MKTFKVEITQEDINQPLKIIGLNYCESCPLARALTRALRVPCSVGANTWWKKGENVDSHDLSSEMKDWVHTFDTDQNPEPTTFEVTL